MKGDKSEKVVIRWTTWVSGWIEGGIFYARGPGDEDVLERQRAEALVRQGRAVIVGGDELLARARTVGKDVAVTVDEERAALRQGSEKMCPACGSCDTIAGGHGELRCAACRMTFWWCTEAENWVARSRSGEEMAGGSD